MSLKASITSSRSFAKARWLNRRAPWGVFALVCGAIASTDAAAQNELEAAYVVMGPDDGMGHDSAGVARAVFDGDIACPQIEFDDGAKKQEQQMDVRAKPSGKPDDPFPVTVCEKLIPAGTKSAAIQGKLLPVPKDSLARIVVLGDTGCRLELSECKYPPKWPFLQVSKAAAKSKPDLVIHVGDYRYRANPKNCEACDSWYNWKADFFEPAKELLAAAPWIVARGNHEICTRNGRGYFRLLADTKVAATQCDNDKHDQVDIAPYTVTLGEMHFIVFDSSGVITDRTVDRYAAQFKPLQPTPPSWLITHVPVWGVKGPKHLDKTLQQALEIADSKLLDQIELFLSGHIHLWEAIGFRDRKSPQFILGDGGADLASDIGKISMPKIGNRQADTFLPEHFWGFTQFAPTGQGGWTATLFDQTGKKLMGCNIAQGKVDCSTH